MNPSDISLLENDLRALLGEGESVVMKMNATFMESSRFLEHIVDASAIMKTESRQIIDMVTWSDGSEDDFNKLATDIIDSLSSCAQLTGSFRTQSEFVVRSYSMIENFIALQKKMMNTLLPLKTMRTFFLVEISKLETQRQKAMLSVVSDIESLYRQAEKVTAKELEDMESLQRKLSFEKDKIENLMKELHEDSKLENRRMQESLEAMRRDVAQNKQVDVRLEKITGSIAALVSDFVTEIQSDDITGQKVQHVFEAMALILQKLEAWKAIGFSLEDTAIGEFIVTAARVQKKQLDSIFQDYEKSGQQIDQIQPAISAHIKSLDEECLSLRELNTLTTSADGAIQILLEALEITLGLYNKCGEALETLNDLLQPLEQISSESADAVDDITVDLRVVTVNARIMAGKVGANSGLSPLTENVGQISLESKMISNRLRKDLHEFIENISGFLDALRHANSDLAEAKSRFLEIEGKGNEKLHRFRDQALQHLKQLTENAEVIETTMDRRSATSIDSDYRAYFAKLGDAIEQIEASVLSQFGERLNLDTVDASVLAELHDNYTMDSERENHDLAMDSKTDQSATSTGADEDEFILF